MQNQYAWLNTLPGLPLMVAEGLRLLGTREKAGDGDNPEILAWAREVGLGSTYKHDSIAWCGLFMAVVAKRAGKPAPAIPLRALAWSEVGDRSPTPGLGDVLTFFRPGGGHVGLYIGEDAQAFHVLGGNQGDAVSIARVEKSRLAAARRPRYKVAPAAVRPYQLAPAGALSTDEA